MADQSDISDELGELGVGSSVEFPLFSSILTLQNIFGQPIRNSAEVTYADGTKRDRLLDHVEIIRK